MDRDIELWVEAQRRAEMMRTYVLPSLARIAAVAVGIGLGYIIGNL